MSLNINKEVARVKRMATTELKDHYESVCGCRPRSHNRDWLLKKIAWQLQAAEEGGLPERVRKRALAMADDSDLRKRPPRNFTQQVDSADQQTCLVNDEERDPRLPPAGTILSKTYKGRTITVLVGQDEFQFNGEVYRTLSAIANAVTGSHVNGFSFFKLKRKKEDSLCDLHSQVDDRRTRTRIQHARRTTRIRFGLHCQPTQRRLDGNRNTI